MKILQSTYVVKPIKEQRESSNVLLNTPIGDGLKLGEFIVEVDVKESPQIRKSPSEKFSYEVWVYTNDEGELPHLHVVGKQKLLDCCVRLDIAEYFIHGNHCDMFNKQQRDAFVKFIRSSPTSVRVKAETRWDLAVFFWNENTSRTSIPDDVVMPDYSQLLT